MRVDEWRWYNDVWNYLVSIGVCICLWKLYLEGSLPIFVWWCCQGVFHLVVHGVWNGVWAYVSLVCIGCLVLVLVCAYLAGSSGVLYSGLLILLLLCDFPALNRNGWNVVGSWFYVWRRWWLLVSMCIGVIVAKHGVAPVLVIFSCVSSKRFLMYVKLSVNESLHMYSR